MTFVRNEGTALGVDEDPMSKCVVPARKGQAEDTDHKLNACDAPGFTRPDFEMSALGIDVPRAPTADHVKLA